VGICSLTTGGQATDKYIVVGGAGFIGGHFTDRLLASSRTAKVTVYDNFSSGQKWHISHHEGDLRFSVVRADVNDQNRLTEAVAGHDVVIQLAANPDIAAAVSDPDIDFREGTVLVRNVLEAMRLTDCRRILYASGSGVYGDFGDHEVVEDQGGMRPISTYGASKFACEHLISAYCHMFGLSACCFRFGNVVGPRQTHGVGYDFLRKLRRDPENLTVLGNGLQSKSYIHVSDTVAAVLHANEFSRKSFDVFNVATGDYITVTEIARLAIECAGLQPQNVNLVYSGGERGWKGDVPIVRLNTSRIRALGWQNRLGSLDALRQSLQALLHDIETHHESS